MQDIYVVTHAQSQHHLDNRVGGWYDSELTGLGRKQALAAGQRLAELITEQDITIISSDLKRASQTAEIIGEVLSAPVSLDARLRENSYGEADGKNQSWLNERIVAAPEHDRLDHIVVSGAESKRDFVNRIYDSIQNLPSSPVIVIVTHGYALTFVIAAWIRLRAEDAGYVNFAASPAGITYLQKDDFFKNNAVKFLNDVSHLSF